MHYTTSAHAFILDTSHRFYYPNWIFLLHQSLLVVMSFSDDHSDLQSIRVTSNANSGSWKHQEDRADVFVCCVCFVDVYIWKLKCRQANFAEVPCCFFHPLGHTFVFGYFARLSALKGLFRFSFFLTRSCRVFNNIKLKHDPHYSRHDRLDLSHHHRQFDVGVFSLFLSVPLLPSLRPLRVVSLNHSVTSQCQVNSSVPWGTSTRFICVDVCASREYRYMLSICINEQYRHITMLMDVNVQLTSWGLSMASFGMRSWLSTGFCSSSRLVKSNSGGSGRLSGNRAFGLRRSSKNGSAKASQQRIRVSGMYWSILVKSRIAFVDGLFWSNRYIAWQ